MNHLKKSYSAHAPPLYPAFSYVEQGRYKCITYSIFTSKLKDLLNVAGYSPNLYSGHSMRRGGATLLFQLGCNPFVIQAVGDWRTDQFLKYCGLSLEQRYSAQRLMCSQTNVGDFGVSQNNKLLSPFHFSVYCHCLLCLSVCHYFI